MASHDVGHMVGARSAAPNVRHEGAALAADGRGVAASPVASRERWLRWEAVLRWEAMLRWERWEELAGAPPEHGRDGSPWVAAC